MTKFVRVKYVDKSAPAHEFDVPLEEYEANKSRYSRVEKGTVDESRPPKYADAKPTK